ncbi:MAG: DUF4397 domain-containing protein [Chitinophagaceae bacterium]|nr:MAG: DUF4397 domain-containing protein [Chitinophagaceae bacterium]
MAWFLTKPLLFMLVFDQTGMKSASTLLDRCKFLMIPFFVVAFSLFSSCKKDDIEGNEKVKGEAKIKFINASLGSSAIDFYVDDTKVNELTLAYGQGSEYIKIPSGSKTTKVNEGVGTLEASANYNFIPTFSYTSFFVGDKEGKGEVLTFEDNLGAVDRDKSRVRFINLSPNFTNALNVSLPGRELVVNALAFRESSDYFLIDPDTNIGISIVGTGVLKIASGNEFTGGKNYTIWLSGTSNSNLSINKITYN